MKIGQKLILGFMVISLLVGIVGVISILQGLDIKEELEEIVLSNLREVERTTEIAYHIQRVKSNIRELFLETLENDKKEQKHAFKAVTISISVIEQSLSIWEDAIKQAIRLAEEKEEEEEIKEERKELEEFGKIKIKLGVFIDLVNKLLRKWEINGYEAVKELFKESVEPLSRQIQETIKKLEEHAEKEIVVEAEEIRKSINSNNQISIILTSVGFLLSVILGLLISRSLSRPILSLKDATINIGEGNQETKIEIKSNDEIGSLASSFNKMAENLLKTTVSKDYVDSIIKSLMDMLIILNPDGTIRTVNYASLKTLGFSEKELLNKSIPDIIAEEEEEERVGEKQEKLLRDIAKFNISIQEGLIKEYKAFVNTKSGKRIPVILSGTVLRDKEQRLIGAILSLKDVRDSKLIKELKDTQSQLIQSGKLAALGEMSSGLAHEINNPLFLIKGFNNRIKVELSKYNKDAYEKVHDFVREVDENSQRIMKIVNHFRDFSRQAEHNYVPILVNDIISRSFILLKEQLKLRSINIRQNLTIEDAKIMGNGNQLEQVFINIITNARDAIEEAHGAQGGELVVCTRREGRSAVVEFADNGIGVEEEQQQRIFDPFYTTKEVGEGTGLGLSISHGIITEHKGQISCKSKRGKGASFMVTLPLYQEKRV